MLSLLLLFARLSLSCLKRPFVLEGPGSDRPLLRSLRVDVLMLENTAKTSFELTYFNPTESSIEEVKLKFPYDPKMAVSDVILEIGNNTFFSEALEISEAQQSYKEHKEAHETVLLVRRHSDSLIIQLGILPPQQTATIRLTGVTVLPTLFKAQHERWYSRYVLPLSFVPRYTPPHHPLSEVDPLKGASSVDYSFHFSFSAPYAFSVSCSSYSDLTIEDSTRISYSGPLTRDLIVDVSYQEIPHPIIERYKKTQITQFVFNGLTLPDPVEVVNPSIVFLVDRSGSMNGNAIAHVRTALSLFVHSLPPDCEFDIVGFGSTFASLFHGKRAYSDEALEAAISHVKRMAADMGGTEVLAPLKYILEEVRPQYLFFLTDGAVSNTQEILNFVGRFQTKISTLGIGNSASVDLVRGIAEITGGVHEFVEDQSDIEEAVIRSLSDTLKSALVKVAVVSNCGVSYDRIPSSLPRTRLQTFTFFSPSDVDRCEMKLNGLFGNGTQFTKVFDLVDAHSLYSKVLHSAFVITASENGALNQSATIEFARELNLVTRYTGLLLYDNSTKHERVDKVTVDVPVISVGASFRMNAKLGSLHALRAQPRVFQMDALAADEAMPQPEKIITNPEVILSELQSASGVWSDLGRVCELLKKTVPQGKWSEKEMATALAVVCLRGTGKPQFARIIEKGNDWLTKNLGVEETKAILTWATEL